MDYTVLLDIGLGGLALLLYRKLDRLVDLIGTQIRDHEARITALEDSRPGALINGKKPLGFH